ncbi:MAG: cation:proton antiporter [Verrucomicrobiota bacterium]|jgi:CPA1 family monovalent cation:H+ antiporter|nr:cation:proton antiporter [Verrucomicrobiota bacterium]
MKDFPVDVVSCFVGLLLVAMFAAMFFRKIRFPYTIGLVLIGMLLYAVGGWVPALDILQQVHLTPNFILYILLPTLIFDAAINLNVRELLRNLVPILLLAAPGVLIATAVTGLLVAKFTPLSFNAAMLFGALISTTDPVAVIALFNELGAPKRLTMLVDGESLFNDATAIVLFDIVAAIVAGSLLLADPMEAWSLSTLMSIPGNFLMVFAGGGVIGALVGWVMMQLVRFSHHDPLIEIGLTTVVAYAVFTLANYYLHFSGVMAACAAGMVVNACAQRQLSVDTRRYLKQFWGFAAFLANSMIFLMLGLTESFLVNSIGRLYHVFAAIVVGILAILLSRALILLLACACYNPFVKQASKITFPMQVVMWWGGLRGALPIALAVSIPAAYVTTGERTLIIQITLGIILFTLLIQGTTIRAVMRRFGMDQADKEAPRTLPDVVVGLK